MLLANISHSHVLARHINYRVSALGSFKVYSGSGIIGMSRLKRTLRERSSVDGKRRRKAQDYKRKDLPKCLILLINNCNCNLI